MDTLISKYGEEHRKLIIKALEWLDEEEPKWGLAEPINRDEYIQDLIDHLAKD